MMHLPSEPGSVAPKIIGIAGGTASGKTSLTKKLVELAGPGRGVVIELDGYYRDQERVPLAERAKVNYDHPDAFEFSLLADHLNALRRAEAVAVPQYDFALHTRRKGGEVTILPTPYVFVEGILTLAIPELRALFDTTIFVFAPDEIRLARRTDRDVKERGRTEVSVRNQWQDTVYPMHCEFCEPSRTFADLLFDGEDFSDGALSRIWEGVHSRLQHSLLQSGRLQEKGLCDT